MNVGTYRRESFSEFLFRRSMIVSLPYVVIPARFRPGERIFQRGGNFRNIRSPLTGSYGGPRIFRNSACNWRGSLQPIHVKDVITCVIWVRSTVHSTFSSNESFILRGSPCMETIISTRSLWYVLLYMPWTITRIKDIRTRLSGPINPSCQYRNLRKW